MSTCTPYTYTSHTCMNLALDRSISEGTVAENRLVMSPSTTAEYSLLPCSFMSCECERAKSASVGAEEV